MKKQIIAFLKKNGFSRMEANSYANDSCGVVFEDDNLTIADNEGNTITYRNVDFHAFYWLIGVLVKHSFTQSNLVF